MLRFSHTGAIDTIKIGSFARDYSLENTARNGEFSENERLANCMKFYFVVP